jgi:hypothetical protein
MNANFITIEKKMNFQVKTVKTLYLGKTLIEWT